MNKHKQLLVALVALMIVFVSCEKNKLIDYQLDGKVYFYERTVQNTIEKRVTEKKYSFALQNSALMKDTFQIKVKLMGDLADYDRSYIAKVDADNSTAVEGEHYQLLEGVMKANEYVSYLPVVLYRTEDTQEEAVHIKLELTDDGDLGRGNREDLEFELTWGDILLKPENWPDYFFGVYSVNKYRFAIDVLGITNWPQTERITTGPQDGVYTISEIQSFVIRLNEAYAEYRTENGPIYVDDQADVKEEIYYGQK